MNYLALQFSANAPIIFLIVGIVIAVVLAQSIFFLVKSYKRGKEIGMDVKKLNATIKRAVLFTIAPAVAIFIGLVTLVEMLGIALPWLRLSIIGAVTYELPAAQQALTAIYGSEVSVTASTITAKEFITVAFVMTFGIISGMIVAPLTCKKINNGMLKIKDKDKKWSEVLMASMFIGMLSAFLGYIVYQLGFYKTETGIEFHYQYKYWIPVFVMAISAGIMGICGVLLKKLNWKWLNDYALPISMIGSMLLAIPLSIGIA